MDNMIQMKPHVLSLWLKKHKWYLVDMEQSRSLRVGLVSQVFNMPEMAISCILNLVWVMLQYSLCCETYIFCCPYRI